MPLRLSRQAMKMSRDALRAGASPSAPAPRGARRRLSRAAGASVESLESRQLLTAVIAGLFQGTGTQYDGQAQFEYQQGDGTNIRISIFGNVTAEFIAGRTPDSSFD